MSVRLNDASCPRTRSGVRKVFPLLVEKYLCVSRPFVVGLSNHNRKDFNFGSERSKSIDFLICRLPISH